MEAVEQGENTRQRLLVGLEAMRWSGAGAGHVWLRRCRRVGGWVASISLIAAQSRNFFGRFTLLTTPTIRDKNYATNPPGCRPHTM